MYDLDLERIFTIYDKSGDNRLDLEEFIKFSKTLNENYVENAIEKLFYQMRFI